MIMDHKLHENEMIESRVESHMIKAAENAELKHHEELENMKKEMNENDRKMDAVIKIKMKRSG
jgi:hypothetical protein